MSTATDATAYTNLLYEKKAAIAYVTINRPKVLNALNGATLDDLRIAFEDARDDAATRGVILTGAGERAFIAGADINELARLSAIEAKTLSNKGHALLDLIENLGSPSLPRSMALLWAVVAKPRWHSPSDWPRSTPNSANPKLNWVSFRVTAERSGWPAWLARGVPCNLS